MPLEAVLFDFDGTIVDTTELIHESMRRATGEVLGRELDRETLLANVGQPLPRQMELLADGQPEKTEELLEVYLRHNDELHEGLIREFPNVDTTEHKPLPAPLLKGLELLGDVSPERAAYVGDAPFDVTAARDAGVMSVAVSWGAFTAEALRDAGPDHLFEDLDSAVDFLLKAAG
ncbi:MAG: HAD hydrolase-like protein [Actinobacteria bacterium]|nr:HAD hydrolase-like protein [Actinomycetota bacterium]